MGSGTQKTRRCCKITIRVTIFKPLQIKWASNLFLHFQSHSPSTIRFNTFITARLNFPHCLSLWFHLTDQYESVRKVQQLFVCVEF